MVALAVENIKVLLCHSGHGWPLTVHQSTTLASTKKQILGCVVNVREHVLVWLVGVALTAHLHALVGIATLKTLDKR